VIALLAGVLALAGCSSAGAGVLPAERSSVPGVTASPQGAPGSSSAASSFPGRTPAGSHTPGAAPDTASGVWEPGAAQFPPDVAETPSGCAAVPRPDGWLRAEDAQPGQPGFEIPPDTGGRVVTGYADRRSAACGDTVSVALSGPPSVVRLEAYRLGAYREAIGRLIWRSGDVPVTQRPLPAVQPGTNLREASWPVSVRMPVTTAWPPGFYLLVVRAAGGIAGPAIPLIVRDDAGEAPIMFTASTLTWNAYNDWGGYSLYRGPGLTSAARFAARGRVASFRRPLEGSGYRQMVFMDLPVVRRLEELAAARGLDVAYTTDVDVDQRPSQWLRHAELVFGGHSEYWTRRAYDALAAVRGTGVNLVFLGANNLWWHARLDVGPVAVEPDREIVYKTYAGDPTPRSAAGDYSVLWSQWPEHRDAAALLGHSHAAIGVHGGYQVMGAPGWMLAGTGLREGSVLPLAVGNEADGYIPAAANPKDLTVVAAGVLRGARGPVTVSASYYVAPSGAGVFSAGTTDWACGLSGACPDQVIPPATSAALQALSRNIILAFLQPAAGRAHPSVPSVTPEPSVLLTQLSPGAIGNYGSSVVTEGDSTKRLSVPGLSGQGQPRAVPGLVHARGTHLLPARHRAAAAAGRAGVSGSGR
jgi:hypothetical protein